MNTTAESSNSNSRVLIVDDNSEFTHRVSELLQNTHHYVVCEENDPRRALETARSFHPDLILVDLIMPRADGTEVAAQIKSDWMLHSVPIVFVTALITREEARDGRRIEGHRIVPKPGHSSELIKVVEESLPKRFNNSSQRVVKQKSSWTRITKPADLPTSPHSSSITSGQGARLSQTGNYKHSRESDFLRADKRLFFCRSFFGAMPEFFRGWAKSAFCPDDADRDRFRLRS